VVVVCCIVFGGGGGVVLYNVVDVVGLCYLVLFMLVCGLYGFILMCLLRRN